MPLGDGFGVRGTGWILAALTLQLSPAPAAAAGPSDTLKSAIEDFEFGEHATAEKKLHALLNPIALESAEDVILARQYLGACYFLLDQRPRAEAEFAKILVLDAEHKLDPEVFSPALVQFFEDVRARTGLGLRKGSTPPAPPRPEPSASPAPSPTPPPALTAAPAPVPGREPPFALAFVPLGVGQFNNRHPVRGALFAAGELGLATAAVVSFAMFQGLGHTNADGAFEVDDPADRGSAETLQGVFLGTLYASIGLAVVGVAEALISYPGASD